MSIQEQAINTIKKLSLDMIQHAGSGHAGASLDCAPILYSIYHEANVCPSDANWLNRDRVILSNGHASASLYATLHLMGYPITIDDLRDFRVLGSITPGHPEINTPGVDCTTGALGQGFATAVGLAAAERMLNSRYNRARYDIIDHYTYLICGDGDLMEGVSYEAGALAGLWQLNKLIVLYNKNDITIDGSTSLCTAENIKARFCAQGFDVLECDDNYVNIILSIRKAKQNNRPTLIIVQTKIAKGTSYEANPLAHAHPFNEKEIKTLSKKWGLEPEPFCVTLDVYKHFKTLQIQGEQKYQTWQKNVQKYSQKYPKGFKQIFNPNSNAIARALDINFGKNSISTIQANHKIINTYAKKLPNLVVGSADLAKSTLACVDGEKGVFGAKNPTSQNIAFGVREHAMSCITNGICLHGGIRAIASTFLAFSDYMRYGIRMSAMMDLPVLYIFTHDSIALGQDGPTHQPIEQLESLRILPNLMLFRPADANETKFAYMWYAQHQTPTIISLSKSPLPILNVNYKEFCKGGYIVAKEKQRNFNAILIATGSEVDIAIRAKKLLEYKGYSVRVVSMPCRELFEKQDDQYKQSVLPKDFATKVVIEAGVTRSWESMVGRFGHVVGVNTFGESGTPEELYDLFGVSAMNIYNIVVDLIKRNKTA